MRRLFVLLAASAIVCAATAHGQALLEHLTAQDRDGAGGDVVVMEAGVVSRHPADQPALNLGVVDDALEHPLHRVVANEVTPT